MEAQPADARRGDGRSLQGRHRDYTRGLIMAALAQVIVEQGVYNFSVQQVADRAGVAHRTVYHHFPTREAMLEALGEWVDQELIRRGAPGLPADAHDLVEVLPFVFKLRDEYEDLVRALAIVYTTTSARPSSREERTRAFERVIREAAPSASSEELRWFFAVTRVISSSQGWLFFRDYLGFSGEEAGRAVQWALRMLLAAVQQRAEREDSSEGAGNGPAASEEERT